jgi:hypothetical protein
MATVWLPIGKFARERGISIPTARRWADAGTIQVRYTLGGHRRFPAVEPMARRGSAASNSEGLSRPCSRPLNAGVAAASPMRWQPDSSRSMLPSHAHAERGRFATLYKRINELQVSGVPVTIARVDDTGTATTIPAWLFSLEWVKQNLGGGRFVANGVEFLIDGRPRSY